MTVLLNSWDRGLRPRRIGPALVLAAALALSACASHVGPKERSGTLIGALAGGLAGSTIGGGSGRLVAVGVGTLLGAYVGSEVGRSLDQADRAHAERTAQETFEHGADGRAGALGQSRQRAFGHGDAAA